MFPPSRLKSILVQKNNKAKVRQSTQRVVLGKAKVMSFEEARAKHAKKDKATAGKPKCGRKRKNPAPEADMPDPEPTVMWMTEVLTSMLEPEPEPEPEPKPWRAPAARMY